MFLLRNDNWIKNSQVSTDSPTIALAERLPGIRHLNILYKHGMETHNLWHDLHYLRPGKLFRQFDLLVDAHEIASHPTRSYDEAPVGILLFLNKCYNARDKQQLTHIVLLLRAALIEDNPLRYVSKRL